MNSCAQRFALLVFVVIGASCSGKGKEESGQASDAAAAPASASSPGPQAATPAIDFADVGTITDLIVASANNLPRSEFDPGARAASIGKDAQKNFEWVRDHTWWAPYRGLLRGSRGVLLDRVGSSLDRAMLLGDLMRRNGHAIRLAHAQLSEAQASELLGKVRSIPDVRRQPVASKPLSAEQERTAEEVMPGYKETLQQQAAVARQRTDEGNALVRSQSDQLFSAVRGAMAGGDRDEGAAIAALRDHWWVEYDNGGKWTAMDVLLPNAKLGDEIIAASTTSDWPKASASPPIPESDWHTVQIRIVVERYEAGVTSEFTVLETILRPADVFDQPITFSHVPRPWPDKIADPKTDPNAAANASLWVTEWMPFLQVGDRFIGQAAFTDRGDLKTRPLDPVGQLGGGGITGGMDAALGGGADIESFATAEWIDYEVRVPGESAQRLRRPVFDILGPSRRAGASEGFDGNADAAKLERAEALVSRIDILLQPCDFTEEFVGDLMSRSVVADQVALKELSHEKDPAKLRQLASNILTRTASWGPLPALVLWRSALSKRPSDWYLDRTNVLNYRLSRPKIEAGRVIQPQMIDIASNPIGIRRQAGANAFHARLEQGVSDTVAELIAVGGNLKAAGNTASIFAMSPASSERSVLIAPGKGGAAQELAWTADAAARLRKDVDAGYMAVALKQPVSIDGQQRVGWWRIDPTTGQTIGVMDDGFHAGPTAEQAALAAPLILFIQNFLQRNPVPQLRAGFTAAQYGAQQGMIYLHQGLNQRLLQAVEAGYCVPGLNC